MIWRWREDADLDTIWEAAAVLDTWTLLSEIGSLCRGYRASMRAGGLVRGDGSQGLQ
jgi:hypothetical protein